MILEENEKLILDITKDKIENHKEDDDNSYCYESGGPDGFSITIGNLTINLTEEQQDKIRYYYDNT
jgi:hypothetical protein